MTGQMVLLWFYLGGIMMQAQAPSPAGFSWLRVLVIPLVFAVFGAWVALLGAKYADDKKAKRAKAFFMRAIGLELDSLGNQLDTALQEVKDFTKRVQGREYPIGVHFAHSWQKSVFTIQIAKLRDVDDRLMIDVIHFYSDLDKLEQSFDRANESSTRYNDAALAPAHKAIMCDRLLSALRTLEESIPSFGEGLRKLRAKLSARNP